MYARLWAWAGRPLALEGFPDVECALADAETMAALAEEWEPLARVTARIVELGGKPIPPRPR
jgi:hypothetical protein